ncbi:MAG: hypothetical protein ACPG5L_15895 [Vibrio gallaecicus]
MIYYKDSHGQVFGFKSDGTQDHLIKDDMTEITESDARDSMTQKIDIESYKIQKLAEVSAVCSNQIEGSFVESSTEGLRYGCRKEDQLNINTARISTINGGSRNVFAVKNGVTVEVSHTSEQILEVFNLIEELVARKRKIKHDTEDMISKTTTKEAIDSIVNSIIW